MREIIKKATREAYGDTLVELGKEHKEIVVLDADLAGATKSGNFKKVFPLRFFDCGIAEGNMMSVAAGLATVGKVPFASTFAMFASGRAFEQVRNSIGYPGLHVIIGASHAGLSVGEDGATHQCLEDFALMASIPGMTVLSPSDYYQTVNAVKAAYEMKGPVYIRLCRMANETFHNDENETFEVGKGIVLREGNDVTLVATGLLVSETLKAADLLAEEGVGARVIEMPTIKPLDLPLLQAAAKETKGLVTVEDHFAGCGMGAMIAAALAETTPARVIKVGVQDKFGQSGSPMDLFEAYGMTAPHIKEKAMLLMAE